jgi:hypothetical protein
MATKEQSELAYKLLEKPFEYPGMVERSNITERIRLWVYPSFQPFVSFTIGSERNDYYLRRVVWNHQMMTMTDEPQTYCCEVPIKESVYTELNEGLSKLVLSPFISSSLVGIDGVRYGIEFGDYLQPVRLSWWSTPPKDWGELHKWHANYINKINGLLPQSSIEIEPALTSGC